MGTPSLRDRLHALAVFVPQFEAPDFRFGAFVEREPVGGVRHQGFYDFGAVARSLITTCYSMGWVVERFDWPTWARTEEARHLRDDASCLAQATAEQLAHLLTVLIRQERFNEGSLAICVDSGLMIGILRRAASLEAHLAGRPDVG